MSAVQPAHIDVSHLKSKTPSDPKFALDIGGSLAKLAYDAKYKYTYSVPKVSSNSDPTSCFYEYIIEEREGQKICCTKFETRNIERCLEYIKKHIMPLFKPRPEKLKIMVTGGGAYKYFDLITTTLNVDIEKLDEMQCLVYGCVFLMSNISDEVFTYDKQMIPAHSFVSSSVVDTSPFLLVSIGSGVSLLKVENSSTYSRVGGTSIGGGTFWGLGTLLTRGEYNFDQLLDLADQGNHRSVDMLVKDIYGGNYDLHGLPAEVIASSFGMAARSGQPPKNPADMIKSLLITVANNIGQLAYLYAKMHNLSRIIFGGFFIRGHAVTMEVITYAVNFWSKGSMRAMFMRHEGYLGAVGAFLQSMADEEDQMTSGTWLQNYVHSLEDQSNDQNRSRSLDAISSARSDVPVREYSCFISRHNGLSCSRLELNKVFGPSLEPFRLLKSPAEYVPDTWDITQDSDAREYWIQRMMSSVEHHRKKAEDSQLSALPDASERAGRFAERYIAYLHERKNNPSSMGVLTVRSLLDAHQHFLREFGFGDAFCKQKKLENQYALQGLQRRVAELRALPWDERQLELMRGLLTGNIFDWGATEAIKHFCPDDDPSIIGSMAHFKETSKKLQNRPWLFDDFDNWLEDISDPEKRPSSVLIFCDNSGADILLGVMPFVMECLSWSAKIILSANAGPAINDVTSDELKILVKNIACIDPEFRMHVEAGHVMVVDNGQTSPCLDLRLTSKSLGDLVVREKVDLIVIEGMGRTVHTNLYASFKVNCLKAAVIKNTWVANKLGGDLFGVVFKYERRDPNDEYSDDEDE